MVSFDVDSLFTNIPLDETIDICVNELFPEHDSLCEGLTKDEFRNLLELAAKESIFLFNGNYCREIDGVAMGSCLGPASANAFMCNLKKKYMTECPHEFKPVFYRRFVDDIFCLFTSSEHVDHFLSYLNSRHGSINFTVETEKEGCLSFLDVKVSRENDQFVTDVYRKPTFSGIFTNYHSFVFKRYKTGLVYTLFYRCFRICSSWEKVVSEIERLKTILSKNKYPKHILDRCCRIFLDKVHMSKDIVYTVPKKAVC